MRFFGLPRPKSPFRCENWALGRGRALCHNVKSMPSARKRFSLLIVVNGRAYKLLKFRDGACS